MAKKFKPVPNDLVVFNELDDAALFRVVSVEGRIVGIVDQAVEHLNPRIQYQDISNCIKPNSIQLRQEVRKLP